MLYVFFGLVPVLLCLAALLSICFFTGLLTDEAGPYLGLSALAIGIIIDCLFLKRWVRSIYQINNKVLAAIYIFYSIGVFGFCMGIPILNFPLCMMAGIYTARKMYHIKAGREERDRNIKRTSMFTALVMVLICCLLTLWAIAGNMIGYEVEFPVSFTLTAPIFWAVVFAGGAFLVSLQYWLTSTAAKVTFNLSN
jgi:hypothetical protein